MLSRWESAMRMVMAPPRSWLPGGVDSSPSILMQRFSAHINGNVSSIRKFSHGLTGLASAIDVGSSHDSLKG